MRRLIAKDPRNAERIFPYLGGEEVNTDPRHAHRRWCIDFNDFPLRRVPMPKSWAAMSERERAECRRTGLVPQDYPEPVAAEWPDLLEIVERLVKPARASDNREIYRRLWWQFCEKRPALRRAIFGLKHVHAITQTSPHLSVSRVPAGMIYDQKLIVFAESAAASLAVCQCRPHEIWARSFAATMKDDLRYTPSDCFRTFPFPLAYVNDPALEAAGSTYHDHRAALMQAHNEGLTKLYNRFHDPAHRSPDIARLRELHHAMDQAVPPRLRLGRPRGARRPRVPHRGDRARPPLPGPPVLARPVPRRGARPPARAQRRARGRGATAWASRPTAADEADLDIEFGRRLMPMDIAPLSILTQGSAAQDVRARLVATLRRDLVGPGPDDHDLAEECLERAARPLVSHRLHRAAQDGEAAPDDPSRAGGDRAVRADEEAADPQTGSRPRRGRHGRRSRRRPAPPHAQLARPDRAAARARPRGGRRGVTWGDYVTEPPLPPELLSPRGRRAAHDRGGQGARADAPVAPRARLRRVRLPCRTAAARASSCPAAPPPGSGAAPWCWRRTREPTMCASRTARVDRVRALTVVLVNRRARPRRRFADLAYAFQARLELRCAEGSTRAATSPATTRRRRPPPGRPALPRRGGVRRRPQHQRRLGTRRGRRACAAPGPTRCRRPRWSASSRTTASRASSGGWRRLAELAAAADAGPLQAALGALPDAV